MQPANLSVEQRSKNAPADIGADHEDLAMREIDHEEDAVNHGIAKREEPVDRAERDAKDELLRQDRKNVAQRSILPEIGAPDVIGGEQRGGAVLNGDATVLQDIATARDRERHGGILFNHEDRRALLVDRLNDIEDLVDESGRKTH